MENSFGCVLDGHSNKDVIYKWKNNTIVVEKKYIAQFDMKDVQLRSDFKSYVSGKSLYVRLNCNGLEGEMTWRALKFELTNQDSVYGKNCSVLTSCMLQCYRKGLDVG